MRLSEWRATERGREVVAEQVAEALGAALAALGAAADPLAYVVWGDDWRVRYQVLAAAPAGLVVLSVRLNVPSEGPRVSGRLVRWNRLQIGELLAEAHSGHYTVTTTLESMVLQGLDADAGRIAAFLAAVLAHVDGRVPPGEEPAAGVLDPRPPPRTVPGGA